MTHFVRHPSSTRSLTHPLAVNCAPGAKWIPKEVAAQLLRLILQDRSHPHLDQFCEFLESPASDEFSKIKPDEWEQFLFLDEVNVDCSNYDADSACTWSLSLVRVLRVVLPYRLFNPVCLNRMLDALCWHVPLQYRSSCALR